VTFGPRAQLRLLRSSELWEGELVAVEAPGCRLLLARVDDEVKAYRDRCPHQGVRLSEGSLSGSIVTCRAHHFEFDLATGECKNPRELRLEALPVAIDDGFIVLEAEPGDDE
jgi:toluene monooxygenase system ferredoxin subunit